ncbi:MAG: hypothetical protein IH987_19890, partial [Planctomycetes bacterium]|nr:hypothetical protein [Planctomycetota bacterium]
MFRQNLRILQLLRLLAIAAMVILMADTLLADEPDPITQHPRLCTVKTTVPITIELSADEATIAKNATTIIEVTVRAESALEQVRIRCRTTGPVEITHDTLVDRDSLAESEIITFELPVRYTDVGDSTVFVQVDAVIADGEFAFSKRAGFNVYLRSDRAFGGTGPLLMLKFDAVDEDLRTGRISKDEAVARRRVLATLNGVSNQMPFQWQEPTAEEAELMEVLGPDPTDEGPSGEPEQPGRGADTIRVMGTVQWQDENGLAHPAFGMTVEIRDDELVLSDLIVSVVTDVNGQYDETITFDDGFLQGGPDIFVRFRTGNSVIRVTPDRPLARTYESDSGVHDDTANGATIVENLGCLNTSTGPACSVLVGMTWIAVYGSTLNGGTAIPQINVKWPSIQGGSGYISNIILGTFIRIDEFERWDWDVIHHEYGHYMMDEFNLEASPGGDHFTADCLSIRHGSKDVGTRLAWAEGWATYFGISGQ